MTLDFNFELILVYMMVFVRIAGMILLNPIFGRTNVPRTVRVGLVLLITLLIAPMQPSGAILAMGEVEYVFAVLKELILGAIYGYVFSLFYYLLYYVGDSMDTDFGIAMAKTFDPATSIQVSFSGQLLTVLFALYLFASGSHLSLIRMYAESFELIPLGGGSISTELATFLIKLFSSVFMLAMKLVAPFMVAEFTLQVCMGVLMKLIPQISVFVINFQLRILLGIILLFAFAPFIGQFIDNYITVMFDELTVAVSIYAGGSG